MMTKLGRALRHIKRIPFVNYSTLQKTGQTCTNKGSTYFEEIMDPTLEETKILLKQYQHKHGWMSESDFSSLTAEDTWPLLGIREFYTKNVIKTYNQCLKEVANCSSSEDFIEIAYGASITRIDNEVFSRNLMEDASSLDERDKKIPRKHNVDDSYNEIYEKVQSYGSLESYIENEVINNSKYTEDKQKEIAQRLWKLASQIQDEVLEDMSKTDKYNVITSLILMEKSARPNEEYGKVFSITYGDSLVTENSMLQTMRDCGVLNEVLTLVSYMRENIELDSPDKSADSSDEDTNYKQSKL